MGTPFIIQPQQVGRRQLIMRKWVSVLWATPQHGSAGRHERPMGSDWWEQGAGEIPQGHSCASQDAGREVQGQLGDPHLLPAGSICIQVKMPLQVCVDSAPSGPAPFLCLAWSLNSVFGEREKGSRKRCQGKWGWLRLRRKEQQ